MADTSNLSNYLKDVADAIRAKKGTEDAIPAANFDTEIASITTSENLDDVLQEQTELIAELEEILKTKSKSSSEPNVFMQEIEPEVKEGIWLQSNKTYQKIDVLESYTDTLEWQEPNVISSNILNNTDYIFSINNKVYFIIDNNGYKISEYDVNTNSFSNELQLDANSIAKIAVNETENKLLYFDRLNKVYTLKEYDLTTQEENIISNEFSNIIPSRISLVNQILYIFSSDKKVYTYDIETNILTNLGITNPFTYFGSGECFYNNGDIYLMGNTNLANSSTCYKFNLTSKVFTKLTNIPYSCFGAVMCLVNNKIYIFGGGDDNNRYKFYIYDIETDTYSEESNLQYLVDAGSSVYANNQILIASKSPGDDEHLQILEFPSQLEYENDTVVIIEGDTYSTQLLPYNTEIISGKILYKFLDVKYFNVEEQEITTIPTYYGDGTQWVKFKN